MHGHNRVDARFYRLRWMTCRARLKDLRATAASLKGAQQFFDSIYPKGPARLPKPCGGQDDG